jgi:hypothetical protein
MNERRGLPIGTDLSFLAHAILIQLCVGENEVILHLEPSIAITIESSVRLEHSDGALFSSEDAREMASRLLPLLGKRIVEASVARPGSLRLTWTDGEVLDVLDSSKPYESYSIMHGDSLIVV